MIHALVGITKWEATADVKMILVDTEHQFYDHIKKHIGHTAMLMMHGNYARDLSKVENEDMFLQLITDESQKEALHDVLIKSRFLRFILVQ